MSARHTITSTRRSASARYSQTPGAKSSSPAAPWLVAVCIVAALSLMQIPPAAAGLLGGPTVGAGKTPTDKSAAKPAAGAKLAGRKASDLLVEQQKFERIFQAMQESTLSRRLIDPADVVKQVGKDPAKLCKYIRDNIAFEPYRGILKGPVGVLSSGRANSADRSLLLAAMLDAAGVKAKLVKGTIAADKMPRAAWPAADKPADRAAEIKTLKACGIDTDALEKELSATQLANEKMLEELIGRYDRNVAALVRVLEENKVPVAGEQAALPTEHWWVRTDSGDLDPTVESAGAKETDAWELKDVPAGQYHTILFREIIVANGKSEIVIERTLRSADVFGKTVTFANAAIDWGGTQRDKTMSAETVAKLKDNRNFVPTLAVEDKASPGQQFDIDGQLVKKDNSKEGGAKEIGGGLGGLFGGGGDDDKPKSKLDECRLEVEIAAPGDAVPLVVKRWLLRPQASTAQKVYDLCTTYEFVVLPEDTCESLIWRKTADAFEKIGQWLKDLGDKDIFADQGYRKIVKVNGELWGFGLLRRNEVARLGEAIKTVYVHDRPTLVANVTRLMDDKGRKAARGFDIFSNYMTPVGPAAQKWADQPALLLGVVDTVLEHLALARPGQADQNTAVMLDKFTQSDGKFALLQAQDGKVTAKGFGPAAARQMTADSAGAVFVAMPGKVASWYRVDTKTGSVLGYVENGGGQAMAEHGETLALVWMMYETMNLYATAGKCMGLTLGLGISMEPEEQRQEVGECFCSLALEAATSAASMGAGAHPHGLLDFAGMYKISKEWGHKIEEMCAGLIKGEGHGGGGE